MVNMTDKFYDLVDQGYIYGENESGNMSYGEYVAVQDYFWDIVASELESCYSMEEAYERWRSLVETADDDTKMFWGLTEDEEYFEFEFDRDEGVYHVYGVCPEPLLPFLREFEQEAKSEGWRKE